MNNKYISVLFITLICFFSACKNNHKADDGHEESTKKEAAKDDHGHEEGAEDVAILTEEQMKAVDIRLGDIENKNLSANLKLNGVLNVPNSKKANVTALYGGNIKTLNVQIGSFVRKGQVLATIVNPQFVQLQEDYLSTNSQIVFAEQEEQRQKELFEGNAGARKNLQSATATLSGLRAKKMSLQKQIQLMGINPGNINNNSLKTSLVITSPINGTVSNLFATIGSYVDATVPVAEIVDNSSLHLDLQVFEKDLSKLKVGQMVNFQLTNNPEENYRAKIFSIGAAFENESKTIAVHCNVIDNKAGLIDGMNVTGLVHLKNETTAAVPNEAIVESDGKFFIIVQKAEAHQHEGADTVAHEDHENHEGHDHEVPETKAAPKQYSFEKVEVMKGVSDLGYTAIIPIVNVPRGTKIVTKGAFFINAKLSGAVAHEH